MILQPYYLNHSTGEEFYIQFFDIVKISRFVIGKEHCITIHTDKFKADFALSLRRKEDVEAFEKWIKYCKEKIKAHYDYDKVPTGITKFETKFK